MKLNHLNLTATDPVQSQAFLAKYFGMGPMGKPNDQISFLTDENGIVLSLTNMKLGGASDVKYPATFDIGFIQESVARVDAINERLKADGFDVPPPSKQHGSWTFGANTADAGERCPFDFRRQ